MAQKLDDLNRKVEPLALRNGTPGPARPARPELDPMKVYAVPVDGHPARAQGRQGHADRRP